MAMPNGLTRRQQRRWMARAVENKLKHLRKIKSSHRRWEWLAEGRTFLTIWLKENDINI